MFQHAIKQLLRDLDEAEYYLGDILATDNTKEEHDKHLRTVLHRLYNKGFHLRKEKCLFEVIELQFLGHLLAKEDRKPLVDRIEAIANAPVPNFKSKL